jgi:hypothetical protein
MKLSTALTTFIATNALMVSATDSSGFQDVPAHLVSKSSVDAQLPSKKKRKGKKGGAKKDDRDEVRRVQGQMRATLHVPTEASDLVDGVVGTEAIMFFEDSVQQALEDTTEDDLHVRFVVVEDISDSSKGNKKNKKHKKKRKGGRHLAAETVVPEGNPVEDASGHLRGHRALYKLYSLPGANGYWFNIWAYISLSCRFCETHDYASESSSSSDEIFYGDDDYYRPSSGSSASLDTEYADDDDFYDFYTRGRNGGHRLLEDASGFSADFQGRLCEILSEGPIEVFRGAKECQTLFAWN